MKLRILIPPQFAAHRRWRWQLLDERDDRVLAESPELTEPDCDDAIRRVQAAFSAGVSAVA